MDLTTQLPLHNGRLRKIFLHFKCGHYSFFYYFLFTNSVFKNFLQELPLTGYQMLRNPFSQLK